MDHFETEVLIIGCGIAGGTAALQLANAGIPVTVITRAHDPHESNTFYAQGGIIYKGQQDSAELLVEDIVRAGAGHNNLNSVGILAKQGPELVRKILLEQIRVPFDRNGNNNLSLAREGGHSRPRIIHAADITGQAISTALIRRLHEQPNITLLSDVTAVDLIVRRGHRPRYRPRYTQYNGSSGYNRSACVGASLLDQNSGQIIRCVAKNTILATGGFGQIFRRTTNPAGARGDGMAMAYRAGARVIDMEYVQFHPTAFFHPNAALFLISEAVRGAGARLVDADGRPFMQKYDPEWKDLAPRDLVARSIHQEMKAGNVSNVYLDLASYVTRQEILEHFPNIYRYCLSYGIDITRDLAPVVPAAHYACGGVGVNGWGQTSLDDLYAVGEVSCTGVHGANRLASTSLLEGLVWGCRAAVRIQQQTKQPGESAPPVVLPGGYDPPASLQVARTDQYLAKIKQVMWDEVGLVRTTSGLEHAVDRLHQLETEIETVFQNYRLTDELVGLRNAVQVAHLVAAAALRNETSLGCHYRAPEYGLNGTASPLVETAVAVPAY